MLWLQTKVDSITMKSLPNVRFEFKLVGGSYRQEFTTDVNGEIDLSKLTPGAYEVRELEAPEGYLIDDAVRVVQVNPDENANFVFTNTPKPSLRLIKTSSDGTRLGGVHFRIARIEDGTHYLDRSGGSPASAPPLPLPRGRRSASRFQCGIRINSFGWSS